AGPGQPADLVESAAGQLLSAGRVRDDRLGSDLFAERSLFRILTEMPEVVVVHVIPVDDLDAPQILGVEDSLEAGGGLCALETLAGAARPRRSCRRRSGSRPSLWRWACSRRPSLPRRLQRRGAIRLYL